MAFITKKKGKKGKYYVFLIQGYREDGKVKHRVLKNYGPLEDLERKEPGAFERLRQEARDGLIGKEEETELLVKLDTTAPITEDDKNYGWMLFDDIYRILGIEQTIKDETQKSAKHQFNLNDILRLLVYQRILKPGSKLATIDSQKELFGTWQINENAMYRSLGLLNEMKEAIQLGIHQVITKEVGRVATLVFYDVTNYQFEIDLNDDEWIDEETGEIMKGLRKKGACKKNGKDPIIQMGLFMDSNGIPISYKLFSGNVPDVSTYCDAIKQVKKQFGIEKVVVVADKAMNSGNNIVETSNNNDGWLFSQKHRGKKGVCKKLQAYILDTSDWLFNENETFAFKSMIRTRKVRTSTKPVQTKEVTEKVLVTWSQKYANREQIRRDKAIDYASKLTNANLFRETCKKGGKKYLELFTRDEKTGEKIPFSPVIELDQEAVDFDAQFDGINVLVTSETTMSDEEMMKRYKELAKIEDCFRVTKTEFDTRPVYVYKSAHIEAHFLSCFLALVLMRILQNKINYKMSPRRIVNGLNSAKANPLTNGYWRVQANENLIELHEILGIDWNKNYVKIEDLNRYAKGGFTTLKST